MQARSCGTLAKGAGASDLLGGHVVERDLHPDVGAAATWADAARRYAALSPNL